MLAGRRAKRRGVCEDVEDNPYQRLARIFAPGAEEGGLCLGTVASWPDQDHPTRPHRVIAGGTSQEREDLLSSPGLLPYGLAAHLLLDENPDVAAFFNQRYAELLSEYRRGIPAASEDIQELYGGIEYGPFARWD